MGPVTSAIGRIITVPKTISHLASPSGLSCLEPRSIKSSATPHASAATMASATDTGSAHRGVLAAVDEHGRAADPRRARRGEEGDHGRHFFGCSHTPAGDASDVRTEPIGVVETNAIPPA